MNITWIGSPNFDKTRKPIKQVVIHWIVGNLASADAQFQKTTPGTSAHYGVEDETIHQYVKEEHTAYAVGVYARNQETISIEHSASSDRPASDKTYETSGKLIADICQRNNIPIDRSRIIGHKEIKATQCPGTIDIDRLINLAKNQEPMAIITQKELNEMRLARDTNHDNWQKSEETIKNLNQSIKNLQGQLTTIQNDLSNTKAQLLNETEAKETLQKQVDQLSPVQANYNQLKQDFDSEKIKWSEQFEKDNRTIAQLKNSSYKTLGKGELLRILLAKIFNLT